MNLHEEMDEFVRGLALGGAIVGVFLLTLAVVMVMVSLPMGVIATIFFAVFAVLWVVAMALILFGP